MLEVFAAAVAIYDVPLGLPFDYVMIGHVGDWVDSALIYEFLGAVEADTEGLVDGGGIYEAIWGCHCGYSFRVVAMGSEHRYISTYGIICKEIFWVDL